MSVCGNNAGDGNPLTIQGEGIKISDQQVKELETSQLHQAPVSWRLELHAEPCDTPEFHTL